jgi:serine/threonine-protein kinase
MVGQEFGNYVVREKIGEGGMGEVFLAEHRRMGRKAAIKVLRAHGCANPQDVERFFNEARAASIVDHPGVVQIFDCDFHANGAYLTMEYLEGESLAALLRRTGGAPLAVEATRSIGGQIANVLAAVHAKGIVHRDLKPDNVFLESKHGGHPQVRILDFGIAKLVGPDVVGLTKSGMVLGTPTYMAPEQCAGDRDIDTRADIYSLGCILFEMATGAPPFVRGGVGSLITAHMSEPAPAVDKVWPGAPAGFVSLIGQMLSKEPADRPQTMGEVEVRLAESLRAVATRPTRPLGIAGASSSAPTLSLVTQEQVGVATQVEPAEAVSGPTALLPSTDRAASPELSSSVPAPPVARLQRLLDEVERRRVPLLVAAAALAVGLVIVIAASRSGRRASGAPPGPIAAPVRPSAAASAPSSTPAPTPVAQPTEATAPAQAELPSAPAPSVGEAQPETPPAAEPKAPRRERTGSTAEGEGRAAAKRRGGERTQPKKEVRGFVDF